MTGTAFARRPGPGRALALALALATAVLAVACSTTPQAANPVGKAPASDTAYVTSQHFDAREFLPRPPAAGSPAARAELEQVRAIMQAADAARRAQAAADGDVEPWAAFAAALGQRFSAAQLPLSTRLLENVLNASSVVDSGTKALFARPRPFVVDPAIEICWPAQRAIIARSGSFPSGHANYGWLVALVLAEAVPERGTAILVRGREYGESRVICGVHYPTDVEAGRVLAAGAIAAMHSSAEFQRDFAAARRELRAALALPLP